MLILLKLFVVFLRIGALSFGGGYAMITQIGQDVVSNGWMASADFDNTVAVSMVTPGPIAVNMASFVGFGQAGIVGALTASFGVALPSFVLVMAAMKFISMFKESKTLGNIFYGLRPAVVGLIAAAAVRMALPELLPGVDGFVLSDIINAFDFRPFVIMAVAFVGVFKFKVNPIVVISVSALAGMAVF